MRRVREPAQEQEAISAAAPVAPPPQPESTPAPMAEAVVEKRNEAELAPAACAANITSPLAAVMSLSVVASVVSLTTFSVMKELFVPRGDFLLSEAAR